VHPIRIIGPRDPRPPGTIDTTSHSGGWSVGLSPFHLGPCKLYGDYVSLKMENGWQRAKVYAQHVGPDGPNEAYWAWAQEGWANARAIRYPMGRNARPLYSWWDGEKLSYIEARKRIYLPLYRDAVAGTEAFAQLQAEYKKGPLVLWDFDGYRYNDFGMSLADVLYNDGKKMGHAFVLAMMLEYGPGVTPEDLGG
jgi:hypothetical protein